jgi:methyl-accepting chemotaxis protein
MGQLNKATRQNASASGELAATAEKMGGRQLQAQHSGRRAGLRALLTGIRGERHEHPMARRPPCMTFAFPCSIIHEKL